MKKNNALLLLSSLPLLMGNSARPYYMPEFIDYENYEISNVDDPTREDNINNYKFDLKNNGEGIINLNASSSSEYNFKLQETSIFIFPGETKSISVYKITDDSDEPLNTEAFSMKCYDPTKVHEITIKQINVALIEESTKIDYEKGGEITNYFEYRITFTYECESHERSYYDFMLVSLSLNGKDYYLNDDYYSFYVGLTERLDFSTVEVNNAYLIETTEHPYEGPDIATPIFLGLGFIYFFILIFPGLVVGLVFLIRGIVKHNKKKKAAKENQK